MDRCPVCDNWLNEPELWEYPAKRADPICRRCGWSEGMTKEQVKRLAFLWNTGQIKIGRC